MFGAEQGRMGAETLAFGAPCSIGARGGFLASICELGTRRRRRDVANRIGNDASTVTMLAKKRVKNISPTVDNRLARNRYDFLEVHECGIELQGTEIKAVRDGKLNIKQGYARVKDGELFLHNVHIAHWANASKFFNHDPLRVRRLLLHKHVIRKLATKQHDPGLTLVPTRAYFNKRGFLKVEVALARGKKLHDKREDIKRREAERETRRVVKSALSAY